MYLGAAHILGKMEHTKVSQGLWQLCAIQVEQLSKVRVHTWLTCISLALFMS